MIIGGLQPVTLLDYPQKVAAIIFTSGCNMRCPFCYNPSLVLPDMIVKNKLLVESEVLDFLIRRKKYLDGVVITGGEPTIHADLSSFCQKLKDIGYDIKLDTNGLRPEVIKELIDGRLVDYIAMDIKGPADMIEKFAGQPVDTEKIKVTIELVKNSNLPYEFRSTVVSGFHRSEDIE